jgi:hypothetical protein
VPPGPGMVSGGIWDRADGELVRRVTLREMSGRFDRALRDEGLTDAAGGGFWGFLFQAGRSATGQLQNYTVQVPVGSVMVVMLDGRVTDILPPGQQTTLSFFKDILERIRVSDDSSQSLWQRAVSVFSSGGGAMVEQLLDRAFSDRLQRTSFYLIDRRPIPVHYQYRIPGQAEGHTVTLGVTVSGHLVGGSDQAAMGGLTTFIDRMVGDRESLNAQVVHQRLLPHVERLVKDGAQRFRGDQGVDLVQLEAHIRERLALDFGNEHGLRFDVLAAPRNTIVGIDLHLGLAPTPDVRVCVSADCDAELGVGKRFCTRCGAEQPSVVKPDRNCAGCGAVVPEGSRFCIDCGQPFVGDDPASKPLISQDNQQVELDLVMRVQGDREITDTRRIVEALADAASRLVRSMPYDALASADGFRALEEGLRQVAVDAIRTLDLRLIDLTVLDCKSRNGEWIMNARAEIERARSELTVGREWLEIEGERIDIEALTLELVLRREQVQRDTEFSRLRAELEHARRLDEAQLLDREARQAQLDREAGLDVADAQRDTTRAIGQDQATRSRDRHMRSEDHTDSLDAQTRQGELEQQSDEQRRQRETSELDHQIGLEDSTAAHEDKLARQTDKLASDRTRLQADDEDYSGRKKDERDLERVSRQQDLDEQRLDKEQQRELEELRVAAEIQRQRMEAETAAEQARLEAVKDMDTAQVLAAAAHGRELTEAEAAALAQAAAAGNTQALEAMERLMAEKDANKDQMMEVVQRMSQQAMDQKNQDSERMAAFFQQAMDVMAQNTQAVVGSQQQQQRQVVAAHQAAADSARSLSERSMDAHAQVAAAASRGPQQVIHTGVAGVSQPVQPAAPEAAEPKAMKACVGCGHQLSLEAVFCGECGTRQG